ncbi:MAG: protein-S-isoprenylcysteine methyltransferase [Pseudomonadales bacterium]|nr:protein-S-isoprenylcysteine methyltransferase [Pseudomonadales bacterium]
MTSLELKIPPLALVPLFGLLMWLAHRVTPDLGIPLSWRAYNSVLMGLIGFAAALAGVVSFRRARTTVDPRVPHHSSALVANGIYRYSRNPMYLGFLSWLLAWGLYLDNAAAILLALAFVPYMNRFQIIPEERALQQRFGEPYTQYCQRVRRWL